MFSPVHSALTLLAALTAQATLLSIAAIFCLLFLRHHPAAVRHFVCAGFFAALLSLPLLPLLIPPQAVAAAPPLWFHFVSGVAIALSQPSSFFARQAQWLAWLWIAGAGFSVARLALGWALLLLELRRGSALTDSDWQQELTQAAYRLDLDPTLHIRLYIGRLQSPLTFGFRNPVILLPPAAAQWSALYRRSVLLHELAHTRRRDWLWNCLAQFALAIFWFHPLVWTLQARLRHEAELACDDNALRGGISPVDYAAVLLDMARNLSSHFLAASGMSGQGSALQLRQRFANILRQRSTHPESSRAGGAALVILLTVLASCASFSSRHNAPAQQVYKIGGEVAAPTLLQKMEPQYSEAARKDKVQGSALLSLTIGADGTPMNIQVARSLRPDLDANAIEAVRQWRFTPAKRKGAPVAVTAHVEVNFKLL